MQARDPVAPLSTVAVSELPLGAKVQEARQDEVAAARDPLVQIPLVAVPEYPVTLQVRAADVAPLITVTGVETPAGEKVQGAAVVQFSPEAMYPLAQPVALQAVPVDQVPLLQVRLIVVLLYPVAPQVIEVAVVELASDTAAEAPGMELKVQGVPSTQFDPEAM